MRGRGEAPSHLLVHASHAYRVQYAVDQPSHSASQDEQVSGRSRGYW